MKTKFLISCIDIPDDLSVKECYERYYKKNIFLFDENTDEIYIIFDSIYDLKEGDRVQLYFFYNVAWKCINIFDNIIEYVISEE